MLKKTGFLLKTPLLLLILLCACTPAEKKITGTIEVPPEMQKAIKPDAVLYIVARREGETSGPPVAVKRFTQPFAFPLTFQLTGQDAMIPDTPFEGKFKVTARIAQRGSATPVMAGDIEGEAQPNPVAVGEKNLKVQLDKIH